jgi:hypothetical protein
LILGGFCFLEWTVGIFMFLKNIEEQEKKKRETEERKREKVRERKKMRK